MEKIVALLRTWLNETEQEHDTQYRLKGTKPRPERVSHERIRHTDT